jgi:predicted transcriptional regulator
MPTVSVKLTDATKQRLQALAQSCGVTSHAVMVQAIETALSQQDEQRQLVSSALRAREQALKSGQVVDGHAFVDFLKAKVRGGSVKRPKSISLASLISGT